MNTNQTGLTPTTNGANKRIVTPSDTALPRVPPALTHYKYIFITLHLQFVTLNQIKYYTKHAVKKSLFHITTLASLHLGANKLDWLQPVH